MDRIKVAVIGIGPAGLTALKCLREENFDAVGFERRDRVGGLWAYSDNTDFTSILDSTVINLSKFVAPLSDFPLPRDYPIFPSGRQMGQYFQDYAQHFQLDQHIRFNTSVNVVTKNEATGKWDVSITGPDGDQVLAFDKVVFAHGPHTVPNIPPMPGRELFQGSVIHGQQYRRPDEYAGKKVLVVGNANSGCEVALHLSRHAAKLYHSYRRGRFMASRYDDQGICIDSTLSWPAMRTKYLLDWYAPWLTTPLVDDVLAKKMVSDAARCEPESLPQKERLVRARRKVQEDWHMTGCPSLSLSNPNGQENWFPAVYEGRITPARAFEAFTGPGQVRLVDGSEIEVDVVIFCTGYRHRWDIMPELEMDGACDLPLQTAKDAADTTDPSQPPHLPRLFRLLFPPKHASSIAFLSHLAPQENAWCVAELASMAVAQIWAAESAKDTPGEALPSDYRKPALLPSVEEMEAEVDGYHQWWRGLWAKDHSALEGYVPGHTWYRFLHEMAGTGVLDHLDHFFTTRGFQLWWKDRRLHTWLSWGPMNAHAWRLFPTNPRGVPGCGRKSWSGARKAVEDAYDDLLKYRKDMKDEQLRKKEMLWDNDA